MRAQLKIGILSLQGAIEPHEIHLREIGVEPVQVRRSAHLKDLSGIILPGGESTTMIHLLKLNGLWDDLKEFSKTHPTWGVCAGSILLAKNVESPRQDSLGLLDISIERNAFGRQTESFVTELAPTKNWDGKDPVEGVFIRAPRIRATSDAVQVLFTLKDEPVMIRQGKILASTFHPELTNSCVIHRYFSVICGQ